MLSTLIDKKRWVSWVKRISVMDGVKFAFNDKILLYLHEKLIQSGDGLSV